MSKHSLKLTKSASWAVATVSVKNTVEQEENIWSVSKSHVYNFKTTPIKSLKMTQKKFLLSCIFF